MGVTLLGQHRSSALVSTIGERVAGVEQAVNPASLGFGDDARGSAGRLGFERERLKYDQLWFHTALPQLHKPAMLGLQWQVVRLSAVAFVDIPNVHVVPVPFEGFSGLAHLILPSVKAAEILGSSGRLPRLPWKRRCTAEKGTGMSS